MQSGNDIHEKVSPRGLNIATTAGGERVKRISSLGSVVILLQDVVMGQAVIQCERMLQQTAQ